MADFIPSPFLSTTAIIIILASILLYHLYTRLRYKLPPGPLPLPFVGNLFQVKPLHFRCYQLWADRFGPIISVWFGSNLNIIVSSPELAREVLKDKDKQLANRPRSRLTSEFSRNEADLIWADYSPHYVKVRKLCTLELFTPKRLEALRPIREDEVTSMIESIYMDCSDTPGKRLMVKKYLSSVALNNVARLTLGKRFMESNTLSGKVGLEFKEILTSGIQLGASLSISEHIPWLRWLYPMDEKLYAEHTGQRDRFIWEIINEQAEAMKKSETNTKQNFVGALLTLKDKYDISDDTINGLLWDMITAGMDTTAIIVEWAMAELIRNPLIQQKVQEELDRVIGQDRVMNESDIINLPYLQAVTKESMRLHPSTPLMLPHRANTNVKLGGYDIPKDSVIQVNIWAIARDPAVWVNPLEFRPERFFEEDVDMKGHDFRLLPFGAGRRVCPGAQLGINLVTSMLGHLLHHFNWNPPEGVKTEEIDMSESLGLGTYMATPLQAVPLPRLSYELYKRIPTDM